MEDTTGQAGRPVAIKDASRYWHLSGQSAPLAQDTDLSGVHYTAGSQIDYSVSFDFDRCIELVESGDYASSSEVGREALRVWKRRRALEQIDVEELRHLWQERLASGPGRYTDMAAIRAEARRRQVAEQDTEIPDA